MERAARRALARLVRAARDWAPTNLTRTGAGTKNRLEVATHYVEALGASRLLEELEGPGVPEMVALHGKALQDVLDGMATLVRTRADIHAMEIMVDQEGVKFRINRSGTWGPGFGEPRGSQ